MRIARFVPTGGDPAFGIVELAADQGEHPDTIAEITGDPVAAPVQYTGARHELSQVRVVSPVIPGSKVVGVGRNYAEHAAELGNEVPAEPLIFLKPNTAVIGHDEPVIRPSFTHDLQYEGELAVVIGRICKEVPPERAQEVIFGFTVGNDITARDLQGPDKQWARAKGSDTFCPLGPWMVTHLSVAEASNLSITTRLDGQVVQQGNTRQMIRAIPELISYISSFTTLLPGDVILTGTPAGVGPMEPGQRVEVEIDGIGTLANTIAGA